MAGCLSNHYSTAFHGHSSLADKTTLLFASMVSLPCASLCWSVCIWCDTSCTLDHCEWWTSLTCCPGSSSIVQITANVDFRNVADFEVVPNNLSFCTFCYFCNSSIWWFQIFLVYVIVRRTISSEDI